LRNSPLRIHDLLSNYEALSVVEFADEANKMAVIVNYAPFLQDSKDLAAVDAVIGLGQVDEEHVLPIGAVPLVASDAIDHVGHVEVRAHVLFESGLVASGAKQVLVAAVDERSLAFSAILLRCERTTIWRMSCTATQSWPFTFERGTSFPSGRGSGLADIGRVDHCGHVADVHFPRAALEGEGGGKD
jgi:hypothetical protein